MSLVTGCCMHGGSRDPWLERAIYADSSEGPRLKSYFTSKYTESKITQAYLTYHKNCQLANGDKTNSETKQLQQKVVSSPHTWICLRLSSGSQLPVLTAPMKKGAGKEQDFRICRCSLGKSICWLKTGFILPSHLSRGSPYPGCAQLCAVHYPLQPD